MPDPAHPKWAKSSWNAKHPLRAVRFRDVGPADRRRTVAAGLDAFQEVQKIGLQVHFIVCRGDAVDAGSTVPAGQPIGLQHPIQIDDVVERAQRRSPFRPRQIGYPLSVGGQVCGVQSPLPCVRSTVLSSWRLPSLRRVPASPVPRLHRYYEGATTSRPRAPASLWFRSQAPRAPPVFVFAEALLTSPEEACQARNSWSAGVPRPACCAHGRERDLTGFLAIHPMPLPCSKTPAEPTRPRLLAVLPTPPPGYPRRRPQLVHNIEANTGLQHPLSTLHERRCRRPCKTRFRLAGCASTGRGSNPLDRCERFQATFPFSFPGLLLSQGWSTPSRHSGVTSRFAQNRTLSGKSQEIRALHKRR